MFRRHSVFPASARRPEREPKLAPFSRPWFIRLAGTHNGDEFQKVHDENEVDAFVTRFPDADFYLTEYCDYRLR